MRRGRKNITFATKKSFITMLTNTRGIVLHAIPYNDTYAIVAVYTEAFGRVSYLVSRSRGKKAAAQKALFMPFAVLDMEVEHLPKRDLHRIKDCRFCFPQTDTFCHPVKNVLALFLSEVLFRTVRNTEADSPLFLYIYKAIAFLETADRGIANFHITFLFHLLHYLGIYPDTRLQKDGTYFDLLNGEFTYLLPTHPHYLSAEESRAFARLLRINFENMSLYSFSRQDRVHIINRIFEYYRLHLPDFPEIKSLAVLQSLFD